jgi:alkylhydroperoxidase family enzyme
MTRIRPVAENTADTATKELLTGVKKEFGTVPNLIATMAVSPAVAKAYLAFSQALSGGVLPARLREQIALVVGQQNHCDYLLKAHS